LFILILHQIISKSLRTNLACATINSIPLILTIINSPSLTKNPKQSLSTSQNPAIPSP
jgi:hypothetical protein